jgi:L-aspartate oxidase
MRRVCTESGLHGANRLASNSLLECFVFGEAAAADILDHWDAFDAPPPVLAWDESRVSDSDEEVIIKQNWTEIRRFMWNYVGIQRSTKRLERAAHRIKMLFDEVEDYYGHFRVSTDLIELRNLLQSADLIVRSALKRHESRGLHARAIIRRRWMRRWIRFWFPKGIGREKMRGKSLMVAFLKRNAPGLALP